jgi:hypothetical protein
VFRPFRARMMSTPFPRALPGAGMLLPRSGRRKTAQHQNLRFRLVSGATGHKPEAEAKEFLVPT